jgi:hypothetical protein
MNLVDMVISPSQQPVGHLDDISAQRQENSASPRPHGKYVKPGRTTS